MPFSIDPEFAALFAAAGAGPRLARPVGDVEGRRGDFDVRVAPVIAFNFPSCAEVTAKDYQAQSSDGHQVPIRWYSKAGSSPGSAVLFLHAGGLIHGDIPTFDGIVHNYVEKAGVPYLSVEYRLAPEHPYPKGLEDAYASLVWLHEHAPQLGVNPQRIAVHGESAGGGLAAALAILARERNGPAIAKQILAYPMLDDRVIETNQHLAPFLVWSGTDNETGWNAYLGSKRSSPDLPATASPARLTDATGLPPLYIEVGELDLFRDECVAYASKFWKAGINTELHVFPGVLHAFEWAGPKTTLGSAGIAARTRAIKAIPTP
jgi:acetyl esterase/lipase